MMLCSTLHSRKVLFTAVTISDTLNSDMLIHVRESNSNSNHDASKMKGTDHLSEGKLGEQGMLPPDFVALYLSHQDWLTRRRDVD